LNSNNRLLEQNDVKEAIIDAVTALEIALNDFLRGKLEWNKALLDKMQAFWNLPLPAQNNLNRSSFRRVWSGLRMRH